MVSNDFGIPERCSTINVIKADNFTYNVLLYIQYFTTQFMTGQLTRFAALTSPSRLINPSISKFLEQLIVFVRRNLHTHNLICYQSSNISGL